MRLSVIPALGVATLATALFSARAEAATDTVSSPESAPVAVASAPTETTTVTTAPTTTAAPAVQDRGGDGLDRGRRKVEWLWLRASAGYTGIDLTTFQANNNRLTAELIPSRLSGGVVGLAAGVRLLFISLALRGEMAFFSDASRAQSVGNLELWSLDAEVLLHLLSGYQIEPYLLLGTGYSAFAGLGGALDGLDYRVRGMNARIGVGLDYFLSKRFSVGAVLMGNLYLLTRPGTSAAALLKPENVDTVGEARARVLEADGSSAGAGFTLALGPSLHF